MAAATTTATATEETATITRPLYHPAACALCEVGTSLAGRWHEASIGALERVVGAVLALAQQHRVGDDDGRRSLLSGPSGATSLRAVSGLRFVSMPDEYQPISIGDREVVGIDPSASGLIRVRVGLTPTPSSEWWEIFERGPAGISYSVTMHPPRRAGSAAIDLRAPDAEIERYVEALRDRVSATNVQYESEVAPERQRRDEAEKADEEQRERRMRQAQQKLDELDS